MYGKKIKKHENKSKCPPLPRDSKRAAARFEVGKTTFSRTPSKRHRIRVEGHVGRRTSVTERVGGAPRTITTNHFGRPTGVRVARMSVRTKTNVSAATPVNKHVPMSRGRHADPVVCLRGRRMENIEKKYGVRRYYLSSHGRRPCNRCLWPR